VLNKWFAGLMIVSVLFQYSCDMKSENELYQEIMSIDNPKERISELESYMEKYPESKNKDKIFRRIYRDYISINDEKNAVYYAHKYLDFFPKGYRMSQLNGVAWTLAENNIGLDSAKVYADRAVVQASEGGLKTLNNIRDTQAYVYYQSGDVKRALEIQRLAMTGNENDYDFLNRLGLYQHAAGELDNSYKTIAKSILLGGGLQSGKQLTEWFLNDIKDEKARTKVAKNVAEKSIEEYTKDGITIKKKSQSALLLSVLRVDLEKAEKLAIDAVQSLESSSDFNQFLDYNMNLAAVYNALGNQSKSLSALQKVEEYASIYDANYWLNLGNSYIYNNQKDKAIESFISGMLWQKTPALLSAITAQGLTENEIDKKIEIKKKQMLDFDPGEFEMDDTFAGRIVLTELFTGAECAPCKGADLALDLIAEYYPRSVVTILEYHLHIPGPDPLTNPDSEARRQYYNSGGTPTVFFNGKGKISGGGYELAIRDLFNRYKKSIEGYNNSKPITKIKVNGQISDDLISVQTELEYNSKPEVNLNLNIAIVEKSVNYTGGNGITKHAFVLRYLMTGTEGESIDFRDDSFKYSDSIKISTIQNRQSKYLNDFENKPPKRYKSFTGWDERCDKLNVNQLAIVAWVQNPETKEILQSQYLEL